MTAKRKKNYQKGNSVVQPPTKRTRAVQEGRVTAVVEPPRRPLPPEVAEPPVPGSSGIFRQSDQSPQGTRGDAMPTFCSPTAHPSDSPGPSNFEDAAGDGTSAQRHSTPLPGNSGISASRRPAVDPATRLAEAIENTLLAVRESSASEANSRLVNRLTSAKALPTFSGDPFEWLHFKEAYELTSELGGFSERENIARLFGALTGEAREAVRVLLATTRDAKEVMQTLELHYGNKNLIAEKLSSAIKELPHLNSGKVNMVQFSTKLKNTVAAFKSLGLVGYLHSFDLLKSVTGKLPSALIYAFNRYAAETSPEKTNLEKMADFMHREVEVAAAAGTLSLASTSRSDPRMPTKKPRPSEAGYMMRHEPRAGKDDSDAVGCAFCRRSNHLPEACTRFLREPVNIRWRLVRKRRLCFNCLGRDHMRDDCRKGGCAVCRARHHALLHEKRSVTATSKEGRRATKAGKGAPEQAAGASSPTNDVNQGDTYALLDEGSTVTLIDRKLTRQVGVRGPKVNLALKGINDRDAVVSSSEKVSVVLRGTLESHRIEHALAVQDLDLPSQSLPDHLVKHVSDTDHVTLNAYKDAQPKLLLGQDNWPLIVTRELRNIKEHGLALSKSLLGWVLHGTIQSQRGVDRNSLEYLADRVNTLDVRKRESRQELDELVKFYFQMDDFGVRVDAKPRSVHDHAWKTLKETSRYTGDAWETGLLWRSDNVSSIDSFTTARKRLLALEKRLDRDPEYAALYYKEMERLINDGYAKKRVDDTRNARVWYLPHFGVQNASKPGRLRLVFDAAAKTKGVSLNDMLETGPDLLQPLAGVLLRFRQYAVACKADIKDMFLRVKMREEDRDAQRFLWRGRSREIEPEVYTMTSLIFGAKSSPCSAIYIKNRNAEEYKHSEPAPARSIKKNSYMDDFLVSRSCVKETLDLVRNITKINARANFKMHSWASNASAIVNAMTREESMRDGDETRLCDRRGEKVLGLFWDTKTDELAFKADTERIPAEVTRGLRKPTKREYLRVIMSIFDPLGFLAPFTVRSKILMQKIWRSGIGWDDSLRDEENVNWLAWLRTLYQVRGDRVPRCLMPTNCNQTKVQLHVFCDASLEAYAAAAYLRTEVQNGPTNVVLIMAKSRVAPLKPLSVPRMELQAALLAARLAKTLSEELDFNFNQRFLWSDSATVIRWIKGEPRIRQVFVAHRLGEIDDITEGSEWRWVPSKQNPADSATRWSNEATRTATQWYRGPEFLQKLETHWPVEKPLNDTEKKTIDNMEIRKTLVCASRSLPLANLPLAIRVLGWRGLLAVARRVQAAIDRWRSKPRTGISIESVAAAERYWYRVIQAEHFEKEINTIKNGKDLNRDSKIAGLRPYLDECGILRASGRAVNIRESEFNNHPIILDGEHPATRMLIKEFHRRFYHGSSNAVMNELRQTFYIVGLRKALRSLSKRCIVCRLQRAKPHAPMMSALPVGRVAYRQRPFSHCGIDYFGPMLVKIGRRREKRWGVLFTCLTIRAIHLELAHSLSASSTIMALQRLAARRGNPLIMYSDNGTNFKGASRELKEANAGINQEKQQGYALTKGMKWVFNPPDAPHMGGAWERLVRSVKVALQVVLREQAPTEEVLYTMLTEVEHSVNSRPLTQVPVDARDDEALTPNHFLIGSSSGNIKLGRYDAQSKCLRKQWRTAQSFADAFWKRWLREYLPSIIARPKWSERADPLKRGDLVLIVDLQAPRNNWKRGTIIEVYPGSDGEVRIAKVRTSLGDFTRPARKLVRLLKNEEV
ncbi:uncharacterized protein LOC143363843 [Halictus rubicundus]|uniref:uncharacterized protein LOC143363843 n=1 Tax=Halictus rubicundus TaxID=77578 RepID=UPI0040372548